MLYASLICSGIILLAAFLAARYAKNPVGVTLVCAAAVAFLPSCVFLAFPAVWYQSAILCGGTALVATLGYPRRAIPPIAVASFLIAYAILSVSIVEKQRGQERLRAEYPFESIEDRLPRSVPPSGPGDRDRLDRLELAIEKDASGYRRQRQLAFLHAETTNRFVDAAGFGVGRMVRVEPSERTLAGEPRDDAPPQADYLHPQLAEPAPGFARPDPVALGRLHDDGFLDFVNSAGFGYVKDRRHVAGFQSHGFSKVPGPADKWAVARLELVGLLRHDEPVVYVSSKLPRMDELKDSPTRPLDAFESESLAKLRGGADLYVGLGSESSRFVGAVRSTKQCVECHGGERGALLGAFSYRLRPAK